MLAVYLLFSTVTIMNEQLLERSVAERMFARQATFVEKLIATASSTRTVERNLLSLSLRWTTLQEKARCLCD